MFLIKVQKINSYFIKIGSILTLNYKYCDLHILYCDQNETKYKFR